MNALNEWPLSHCRTCFEQSLRSSRHYLVHSIVFLAHGELSSLAGISERPTRKCMLPLTSCIRPTRLRLFMNLNLGQTSRYATLTTKSHGGCLTGPSVYS